MIQTLLYSFSKLLLRIAPLVVSLAPAVRNRSMSIWELAFVLIMALAALLVFVSLRVISGTRFGQFVLGPLGLFCGLMVVPGCWFMMVEFTRPGPALAQTFWSTYGILFFSEAGMISLLLFLARSWSLWWNGLMFILHSGFWVYIMLDRSGAPTVTSLLFLPVFPMSGIAWLRYSVRREVAN